MIDREANSSPWEMEEGVWQQKTLSSNAHTLHLHPDIDAYVCIDTQSEVRTPRRVQRAGHKTSSNWADLCCCVCMLAAPKFEARPPPSLFPFCRSRLWPLVRRPLRLPCFDRCSLCPNASQRMLWRLSHSPSSSPFIFSLLYSHAYYLSCNPCFHMVSLQATNVTINGDNRWHHIRTCLSKIVHFQLFTNCKKYILLSWWFKMSKLHWFFKNNN